MEANNLCRLFRYFIVILTIASICETRKHKLKLKDDARNLVDVSTFGFFKHGQLSINISTLVIPNAKLEQKSVGLTLDKSISDGSASYLEDHADPRCILENNSGVAENDSVAVVFFTFNFTNLTLNINRRGHSVRHLHIFPMTKELPDCLLQSVMREKGGTVEKSRRDVQAGDDSALPAFKTPQQTNTTDSNVPSKVDPTKASLVTADPSLTEIPKSVECPLLNHVPVYRSKDYYYTSFRVYALHDSEEGLYNLFFHHCKNSPINLTVEIVEENNGPNYLSAGDIPLPTLFLSMSFVYFISACYWFIYLRQHKEDVFKIHYLMFLLVVLKTLSLMFHAMDYHFIAVDGSPMEAFAILFYITYLTKGALLFLNIALIGSGWAFVKPILSEKDKKLFITVIPLQILANVAYIITDTSEEGESQYSTWKAVFVLVDILCCGAILYPVIWSIRHLQEAATTDGKAAISLSKLKLFRHFYTLVVCYIYFTRIIVYLLKVTVPFRYMWLDEFFFELATYIFFFITAYKFRPGSDNPYLRLPSDDEDDMEMDEVLTETGFTETLTKLHNSNKSTTNAVQRESSQSTSA
ncbi:protein GPR107-like [Asterias amurensis]|uniref:protein GPR107-like n=1 Tax=Asterias amurensis TaxID=7602 RepID=UPI003AB2627B